MALGVAIPATAALAGCAFAMLIVIVIIVMLSIASFIAPLPTPASGVGTRGITSLTGAAIVIPVMAACEAALFITSGGTIALVRLIA